MPDHTSISFISSETLIGLSAIIIFLAILNAHKVTKLIPSEKYRRYWRFQLLLMIFLVPGYAIAAIDMFIDAPNSLPVIATLVFFAGAVFVYLMVHVRSMMLREMNRSQSELEGAIQKRTIQLSQEISERKNTETILKKSEARFRALAESSPLMIISIDKDARIQYINQRVAPLQKEQVIGTSVYQWVQPDSRELYEKSLARVFGQGEVVKFETRAKKPNDETGWYFSTIAPIHDTQEVDAAIIVSSDITDQKKIEEQLIQAASRLQSIFDAAVEGILVIDTKGKIVTYNKRFATMWRIPQEVLATKDDNKAISFVLDQLKEPDQFITKVKELYDKPEAESFDLLEFKDGRFFERYSMPERRNNMAVGRVWNFIDITRTKQIEAGLKSSEEKYRKIVEEVADVVYSVDQRGYFTYMNPVCRKLTGYHESDLIGKHFSGLVAPDWRVRVMKFYMNQFRNRTQESVYSFPIVTSTGKLVWVEQTVNQLREGDRVLGYQAVCRDISERVAMQEKLESSNKDLENFAYIASHDLQEPLRMVTSFLGLLEQRLSGKLEDESKEFMNYAIEGAKRMKEMINDLLSYSRIINKKAEFRRIELKELMHDLLFELNEKITETHATIILPDKLPIVVGDEIKLKRLFQNLLTNAIKFARKGTDPHIKISCKEQTDSWSFSIEDNGIGIRKEHFSKLFVIFKRLHAKDEYPGTGIGLAECKKIAELHKGRIWVESTEGKGSTFSFTVNKGLEETPIALGNAA